LKIWACQRALRVLIEEFSKYHEVEVSLEMDDIEGLFSRDEEINLYRIFQETLTNIAKHAKARRISIVILRAPMVSFGNRHRVGFDLEQVLVQDAMKELGVPNSGPICWEAPEIGLENQGPKFHLVPGQTPGTSGGLSF
jgi:signal transduction histidine kinase